MRQAADILSSAPAMQIRYLEAMQQMAKSANSKVIFMPGISSSSDAAAVHKQLEEVGEGPSSYRDYGSMQQDHSAGFGGQSFQNAVTAGNVQNI
jgi:erythrocyte band 7 integral membrane protein